jgi:predicted ATP-grasp superfamily ATP-dependent carboligase
MFNGYFARDGACHCAFTGCKLRQTGPRTGPTTLGVCVHNATVVEQAIKLLSALGYRGIVDMGFRYDARDGRYKLLDANPRLGSTFRLFVAENGLDVVRAMHLDLTDRPVPAAPPCQGRLWLDEPHDAMTALQMLREGSLQARLWRRSLRNVAETAWWAADDPEPFLRMLLEVPAGTLRVLTRMTNGR